MKDCIFTLKDGRSLGYIEYGNSDGIPIFLFHGTPGSRIFGLEEEPLIQQENLRIFTPERPGYGLSDPLKDRTIRRYPDDIAELANHLEIEKFHVAGISGGGPYALSCAHELPERILSATLISSEVPMDTKGFFKELSFGNKFAIKLSKYFPTLLKPFFKHAAKVGSKNPEKLFDYMKPQLCNWDRDILTELEKKGRMKGFLDQTSEAYRQGLKGAYIDTILLYKPWSLNYEKIRAPIFLWHGESDTLTPVDPVKRFSEMLPNCQCQFIEGAGHFLLENEDVGQKILQTIKSVSKSKGS